MDNTPQSEEVKPQEEKIDLNEKQELFCKYYTSDREMFANGTQSYIEAYNIDVNKPGAYHSARSMASLLLTNVDILKRINQLLELGGLNDAFVDKQLEFVIMQNADFSSKVSGIREYNKLKRRITEKLDVTSDGQPIQLVSYKDIKK